MPDFQCLPLPAASDFGQGFLMSAESPQIPGAHRAFAGGSAFFGTFLPCRTAERVRHPPRPEKSSSGRQAPGRNAMGAARSARPPPFRQAAFRHRRGMGRGTASGWARDIPRAGPPRPGAARAGIPPDCRRRPACRTRRRAHPARQSVRAAEAACRDSPALRRTDIRRQIPQAAQCPARAGTAPRRVLFFFIKARNAAFQGRTGRKWIQNHGQAAFPVI